MPDRPPRRVAAPLAAALLLAAAPASARDLSIVSRPGPVLDTQRSVFIAPFTGATGIATHDEGWAGGLDALRAHKDPASGGWDLVLLGGTDLLTACDEGLLEKLDFGAIGGRDHYLPIGVQDCGVGALVVGTVLAWDRDKFPGTPSWADFWDIAKIPGKRGLHKAARENLEFALLADGVAPGDVYRTLRSGEGVDRAFRKLDQLRPYLVWWDGAEEATKLLGTGEVLMTSAPNGRVAISDRDQHRNFGMQWAGAITHVLSWGVMRGSPNARAAQQFLYFSGTPAIEARMLVAVGYPGLAKGSADGVPAEVVAASPVGQSGVLTTDEGFWRENGDKLNQRFSAWLAH
jgi:putative spermidine/putrescine transport system substrate-binding protein